MLPEFIPTALLSAFFYSFDGVISKKAVDQLPVVVFIIIQTCVYIVLCIALLFSHKTVISDFWNNDNKTSAVWTTLIAVIVCVIIPDVLLLYALQQSPTKYTSVVLALVHIAPIFTLVTVYMLYNQIPNIWCLLGILMVLIGVILIILNTRD